MEIVLAGFIDYDFSGYDGFQHLKLRTEEGYKIDLVYRFAELRDSFRGNFLVSYYLCDHSCTKEEAMVGFLNQFEGNIEAEYRAEYYEYSEWSKGMEHDTTLSVGGHCLLTELGVKRGKFCVLTIETIEENK